MQYEQLVARCRELYPELFYLKNDITMLDEVQSRMTKLFNIPKEELHPSEIEKMELCKEIDKLYA